MQETCQEAKGGGKVAPILTLLAGPLCVSWCLERSPGCTQGCVTDLVLAGYRERGGRSSLPLLARGEVISGMSPCVSWNSLGFLSHPAPLQRLSVFSLHDVVWEFRNMPWDNASFSGRLETEPVDKNKVQNEARRAHFPTSILGYFLFTWSPEAGLLS